MSAFRTAGSLDDVAVPMGDRAFFRLNMRAEPDQLEAGEVAVSENGRMERRSWQPRKAHTSLSGSLQVDGDPLRLPFFLVDTPGGIAVVSCEIIGGICFVNVAAHPFGTGEAAYLTLEGLTFATTDPNGCWLMEVQSPTQLTFDLTGADETFAGSGVILARIDDGAAAAIWGSCVFSDPSSSSEESIIEAASGTAFKVSTADGTVTEIGYPVGFTVDGPVDLVQAFDRVFLFKDGVRSLEWLAGATDFTEVPAGVYTQPQVFEATGTDVVVTSGLLTMTVVGNATIAADDMVFIYGSNDPHFTDFVGREYKVTAASATEVEFYIPVEDLATISTNTLSIGKNVSKGLGFIYQPAPAWGIYHQRRMIVPYRYQPGEDGMSDPIYTDREVLDEIVISDILDPHTFDAGLNHFRVTAGVADFTVAAHPFSDDRLLVFNRNSIHQISGISGALSDCETKELTREVGCLARKSIAQYASQVLFLADNGVYAIGFFDEYNLRPVGEPLSAPIQPVIDCISPSLAAFSVGVYFSNRYFLAVPLDSAPGAGDATGNNSILVFNFLNQGWESVDSVADSRWNVLNLHLSRAGERNDIYAVNTLGGVHKLEALDDDADTLAMAPGDELERIPVASELQSRQYDGDTLERKRFTRVQAQIEAVGQSCDGAFEIATEDPDNSATIGSIASELGELLGPNGNASVRPRVGGYRGHGLSVIFTPSAGRPKVKSILVEGSIANRSTTAQK